MINIRKAYLPLCNEKNLFLAFRKKLKRKQHNNFALLLGNHGVKKQKKKDNNKIN